MHTQARKLLQKKLSRINNKKNGDIFSSFQPVVHFVFSNPSMFKCSFKYLNIKLGLSVL